MRSRRRRSSLRSMPRLAVPLLAAVLLAAAPNAASAATFVADPSIPDTSVSTCVAQESAGAVCSLRRALAAADTADGNTVRLGAGTFSVTAGQFPEITHSLAITGAGVSATTIDSAPNAPSSWLLRLNTVGKTVAVSGLTLSGNKANDTAIVLAGTINLTDARFAASSPDNSVLEAAGASATLNARRVSIVGTTTLPQAAIRVALGAAMTFDDSLYARNGTGIVVGGTGTGSSFSARNSTFAGNSASALSVGSGASAALAYDTFAQNSGTDLLAAGPTSSVSVGGTVFSGVGTRCSIASDVPFTDSGYNAASDASCKLTQPTDLPSTDARLGTLADDGASVATVAPLTGSPLLNAGGACAAVATDARGVPRPQGSACDIGAFEVRVPGFGGLPSITGSTLVGNTLTCTAPPYTISDGTPELAFTWRHDGGPVATGTTYTTSAADVGRSITCTATATGGAGATSATSTGVTVSTPTADPGPGTLPGPGPAVVPGPGTGPPVAVAPKVTLAIVKRTLRTIRSSRGFLVSVACDKACDVKATVKIAKRTAGSGVRTINGVKAALVRVKLGRSGLKALRNRRSVTFVVTVVATSSGKTTTRTVTFTARR